MLGGGIAAASRKGSPGESSPDRIQPNPQNHSNSNILYFQNPQERYRIVVLGGLSLFIYSGLLKSFYLVMTLVDNYQYIDLDDKIH